MGMGAGVPCPICGQAQMACGPDHVTLAPFDLFDTATLRQEDIMSDLREYEYVLNGITTTAMLSEKDAERLKATPVGAAPETKSRTVEDKSRTTADKGQ